MEEEYEGSYEQGFDDGYHEGYAAGVAAQEEQVELLTLELNELRDAVSLLSVDVSGIISDVRKIEKNMPIPEFPDYD